MLHPRPRLRDRSFLDLPSAIPRSVLQRHLLPPAIFHLPVELLACIFLYVQADNAEWFNITQVCRRWRSVADSCPKLWVTVPLRNCLRVGLAVEKSRREPLTVRTSWLTNNTKAHVLSSVLEHMWRIRELILGISFNSYFDSLGQSLRKSPAPKLEVLFLMGMLSLPDDIFNGVVPGALRTLALRDCWVKSTSPLFRAPLTTLDMDSCPGVWDALPDFLAVLSRLPNLEKLILTPADFAADPPPFYKDHPVSLPALKDLRIRSRGTGIMLVGFLESLFLPLSCNIVMYTRTIPFVTIPQFLRPLKQHFARAGGVSFDGLSLANLGQGSDESDRHAAITAWYTPAPSSASEASLPRRFQLVLRAGRPALSLALEIISQLPATAGVRTLALNLTAIVNPIGYGLLDTFSPFADLEHLHLTGQPARSVRFLSKFPRRVLSVCIEAFDFVDARVDELRDRRPLFDVVLEELGLAGCRVFVRGCALTESMADALRSKLGEMLSWDGCMVLKESVSGGSCVHFPHAWEADPQAAIFRTQY